MASKSRASHSSSHARELRRANAFRPTVAGRRSRPSRMSGAAGPSTTEVVIDLDCDDELSWRFGEGGWEFSARSGDASEAELKELQARACTPGPSARSPQREAVTQYLRHQICCCLAAACTLMAGRVPLGRRTAGRAVEMFAWTCLERPRRCGQATRHLVRYAGHTTIKLMPTLAQNACSTGVHGGSARGASIRPKRRTARQAQAAVAHPRRSQSCVRWPRRVAAFAPILTRPPTPRWCASKTPAPDRGDVGHGKGEAGAAHRGATHASWTVFTPWLSFPPTPRRRWNGSVPRAVSRYSRIPRVRPYRRGASAATKCDGTCCSG